MAKIATMLVSSQNTLLCLREPHSPNSYSVVFGRSVVFRCYIEPCGRRWIPRSIRACQLSSKLGDDGDFSASVKRLHCGKELLNFASHNFLPLALISGVGLGFANPTLGCLADKYSLSKVSTCGITIISGFALRTEAISAAVKEWRIYPGGLLCEEREEKSIIIIPQLLLVQLRRKEVIDVAQHYWLRPYC